MTEEPYRWLEAIQNRREYIEDQLENAAPVVALSGLPGLMLATPASPMPKLFEVYDHLALGCLGHPADIERVRQAAIETAHLEGFTRSPGDVGSRRLVNYSLGPALKSAFEQIFSAPLMFRGLLAEVHSEAAGDLCWRMEYDGSYDLLEADALRSGVTINGARGSMKKSAQSTTVAALTEPLADWAAMSARARLLLGLAEGAKIDRAVVDRTRLSTGIAYRLLKPSE